MKVNEPTVCFISIGAYAYFEPDTDFPPGGAERQLYLIGQELKTDFDVHFVVGDFGQPATQFRDGITLHRAYGPAADASSSRRISQVVKLLLAMRRADADVYVFRGERTRAVVISVLASLLGKQWVYNLALDSHAELGKKRLVDPVQYSFRWALNDADHVIAQTSYQRNRVRDALDVDTTVVPNGYPSLAEGPSSDDREFFLYVGRIDREQKRTRRFLELARQLPDAKFVLIGPRSGDDRYYDRIVDEASDLRNVTFLGEVEPDDVHEYFGRAIALVNTSVEEGFPNTFLEAWRTETPVISVDVDPGRFLDGTSDGYADGDFGRLVEIARKLADSKEYRQSVGKRERECFDKNYHISVVAEQYAGVLSAALGRATISGDR